MRILALLSAALIGGGILMAAAPAATNSAPVTTVAPRDTLEFLSGDILQGHFLSLDPTGLRWQHNAIHRVLTVRPEGIFKVRLPVVKTTAPVNPDCVAQLTNGDELRGKLISLDETTLGLDTWFGGVLQLPRSAIRSLNTSVSRFKVLYEGPTGLEGWTNRTGSQVVSGGGVFFFNGAVQVQQQPMPLGQVAPGWHYRDGAFYGINGGTLARDLNLPPCSSIEMEVAWRGNPYLNIAFYTDSPQAYSGNMYVLQFSYRTLNLRRNNRTGNSASLGSVELPASTNRVKLGIRTDVTNKTIALYLNDALVKQYVDISNYDTLGNGLALLLPGGQQTVKISNIRVTEWDGRVDDLPELVANPTEDLVRLLNRDKVTGVLKKISNGQLTIKTSFAELDLPLERISGIEFAKGTNAPAAPSPNEVRAFFATGGSLTMQVERWDDQQIVALSPRFGRATFQPAAFAAIQFNLSQQKQDADSFDAPYNFRVTPQILLDE